MAPRSSLLRIFHITVGWPRRNTWSLPLIRYPWSLLHKHLQGVNPYLTLSKLKAKFQLLRTLSALRITAHQNLHPNTDQLNSPPIQLSLFLHHQPQ